MTRRISQAPVQTKLGNECLVSGSPFGTATDGLAETGWCHFAATRGLVATI